MAPETQLKALLGSRLRPVPPGRDDRGGVLVLGAHAADGAPVGFVAIGMRGRWPPLGGLTASPDATVRDAARLARSNALQLDLFGSRRSAHHCLCTSADPAAQAEFLEALQSLLEPGACEIAYATHSDTIRPSRAARSLELSAATATVAALGADVSRATIGLSRATPVAEAAAAAAAEYGAEIVDAHALDTDCDLLLIAQPLCDLGYVEAVSIRARIVVLLQTTWLSAAAERVLRERGVLLVPDAIAGAGPMLAADLRSRGMTDADALRHVSRAVGARTRDLLEASRPQTVPPHA